MVCNDMDKPTLLFHILCFSTLCIIVCDGDDSYIVGGQEAEPNLAPYQVSIQTHLGDHQCGGTIIAERWILTAGHCVVGWPPERLRVATSTINYREPGAIYYVDAIHSHCRYYVPRYHNDLALLQLNSSIVFDERTQAIALAAQRINAADQLLFTGWGATQQWGNPAEQLQKFTPKHVANDECAILLEEFPDVALDVGHLCSYLQPGMGACNGDNGGPLVSNNTLVGVHIWSYLCALGRPDIYTNVLYYREWIRRIMLGNKRCSINGG